MTTTTKPATTDAALNDARSTVASTADELGQHARDAAASVASAAEELQGRLPAAASEVDRMIRSGSDDTLRMLTVGIVGLALGLLVGGANRLLVLAALAPAGMIGLVLSGRRAD